MYNGGIGTSETESSNCHHNISQSQNRRRNYLCQSEQSPNRLNWKKGIVTNCVFNNIKSLKLPNSCKMRSRRYLYPHGKKRNQECFIIKYGRTYSIGTVSRDWDGLCMAAPIVQGQSHEIGMGYTWFGWIDRLEKGQFSYKDLLQYKDLLSKTHVQKIYQ